MCSSGRITIQTPAAAAAAAAKSLQSCLTLSDHMDCSLPDSSIHGIVQARVLEWVAIAFSDRLLGVFIKELYTFFLQTHILYYVDLLDIEGLIMEHHVRMQVELPIMNWFCQMDKNLG